MCYCKNNDGALEAKAAAAEALAADLQSKFEAESSEKKQVSQDLKQAQADRKDAQEDLAKATSIREKEAAKYAEDMAESEKNFDSVGKAIVALEKGMGAAFLQSNDASVLKSVLSGFADNMESEERETVMSFLESGKDYAPASGEIVGILKNMKDEMEKDIGAAKEDEATAVSSYGELKAAKQKEIAATTSAIESKTKRQGELAVSIVQAKNGSEDAAEEAEENRKFAANLKKSCAEKEKQWDERVQTRQEEVAAIGEAIKVLNDDDALEVFSDTLPAPPAAAPMAGTAFLQTRVKKGSAVAKARALLTAQKYQSLPLSLLSHSLVSKLRVQEKSGKVDFSKVFQMIDDMDIVGQGTEG
jgi:RNase H-fold protein (predicted Holliday junction resolvase)